MKLKAKVTASKGANKTLKWTSSNTKYATVSSGKVKALKKSGEYEPVRWKSYIDKVDAYQGEIVSKSEVLKQFKLKVKRSQDQLVLDEWEECDLLLREIFAAFEK